MEKQGRSSPWLTILGIITLIHTSAFLVVTILQFTNLNELQIRDTRLLEKIAILRQKFDTEVLVFNEDEDQSKERLQKRSGPSFFEEILQSQELVIEQHCIDKYKICPDGTKGEKGDIGEQGQMGEKGEKGMHGLQGDPGTKGVKGSPGEQGNNGTSGVQGDGGLPGIEGPKGNMGDTGDKGSKGEQGYIGEKGKTGIQGQLGDKGLPGATGDQGQAGVNGSVGQAGSNGVKGDMGQTGPPGKDARQIPDGCRCLTKPSINHSPSDTAISQGVQTELICHVSGNPKPKVTWYKDGAQIFPDSTHQLMDQHFILINPLQMDSGRYHCQAENSLKTVSSPSWTVVVK